MATPINLGAQYITQQQAVIHGTTVTFTYYKVITASDLGKRIKEEEIEGQAGELTAILQFQLLLEWGGELECLSGANPATDFPEGGYCTLTGLTTWKVLDAKPAKSKAQMKIAVKLLKVVDSTNGGMTIA
jgi:hypothetical protein